MRNREDFTPGWVLVCNLTSFCVSDGERVPMAPGHRVPYQRALSVDSKPMASDGGVGGGLAGRRNVPCPTLVKQESMDAPIRPGNVPNGFPGGMAVCPPRGGATSNLFTYLCYTQLGFVLKSCVPLSKENGDICFSYILCSS